MVTPELIAFIKGQLSLNKSETDIKAVLIQKGWSESDIYQAFLQAGIKPSGIPPSFSNHSYSNSTYTAEPKPVLKRNIILILILFILFCVFCVINASYFVWRFKADRQVSDAYDYCNDQCVMKYRSLVVSPTCIDDCLKNRLDPDIYKWHESFLKK